MASSGTLTGSFSGTSGNVFTLFCYWSITEQSTANRTSTVQLRWAVRKSSAAWQTYKQNATWTQNVDRDSTSGTVNFDIRNIGADTDYFFRDAVYVVIPHEANGTKTATISGTLDLSGTSAGIGSLSDSIVLDAIHVDPPVVNTLTLSDAGTGQSTVGAWVATKSIIKLTATATATEAGASIASYAFYANDVLLQRGSSSTYTGANTAVAGTYVFKVVVTDSYGLTAERSLASMTVLAYTKPTIQTETFRCNSSGTAQRLGTYVRCKATWTICAVGSNAVVLHRVTVNGTNTNLTSGTAVTLGGGNIATNQVYEIDYVVTDKFGTQATNTDVILTGKYDWDFDPDGGVAFGTYAETGKLKTTYDIETSGGLTLGTALPITSGGTGGMSVVNHSLTTTAYSYGNYTSKTYTVSGSGILIVSCTTKTDNTDSYGITVATVRKNGTMVAYATDRIEPAVAQEVAANAVVTISVADGDTVFLGGFSTKAGTKTFLFNILCFGCTVS